MVFLSAEEGKMEAQDANFDEAAYETGEFSNIGDYLRPAAADVLANKAASRKTANKSPVSQKVTKTQRYVL